MSKYGYDAPRPKVFDGPPPAQCWQDVFGKHWIWACECGRQGVSSTKEWAHTRT